MARSAVVLWATLAGIFTKEVDSERTGFSTTPPAGQPSLGSRHGLAAPSCQAGHLVPVISSWLSPLGRFLAWFLARFPAKIQHRLSLHTVASSKGKVQLDFSQPTAFITEA